MSDVKKVVTPEFRVSFPAIFKPSEYNGKEKFGVTMLFSNQTDLSKLKKMCVEVAKEKWGEKLPKPLKMPFRDGNEKDLDKYPSFEDTIFCAAQTLYQPGLVDEGLQPIIDESEFYAGCYARASVSAFAWEFQGKKGISLNLMNVQKLRNGDKLGGRVAAEDEFQAVEKLASVDLASDDEYDDYDI